MDVWALATWMVLDLLCGFAHEVTVRSSDLKPCIEDRKVCVMNPQDCGPRSPSAIEQSLNLSCYYQIAQSSVTCEWSETSASVGLPEVSLIFRSRKIVYSCGAVLNPVATLNITAKMSSVMDPEIWSQPLTVHLYNAVKPSQPVLTVLGSTPNSINVTWRSTDDGGCRLRYRATGTRTWTQAADTVPALEDQTLTYSIGDLLPFTTYGAAVACRGDSNIWSNWSAEVTVRTPDKIPSRPVEVCYTVEKTGSGRSFLLRLRWQDRTPCDPGSRVLGYQVSYSPERKKQLQDAVMVNVTDVTALLPAERGKFSVSVRAYNTAGFGPAARLCIDIQRVTSLPPVANLWVSSSFPARNAVQVHWQHPSGPPVSRFYIQRRPETHPSIGCRITVDSWNSAALIEDMGLEGSYAISVIPVYDQQCGASRSLPASLRHGALMEAVQMKLTSVTMTTVTVSWVWQRKSRPVRVNGYQVVLRRGSEVQTASLWPDQWEHTFYHLKPNTEYSLVLLADNVSRHTTSVKTDFDEVTVVAAAAPPLLLAAIAFIIFLLSRTICKSYFFPVNSSTWSGKMGDWLMNPTPQETLDKKFLDIEDFRVLDVLGDKGPILVAPRPARLFKAEPQEDTAAVTLDSVRLSELVTEPENSANDSFLHKLEETSLLHLSESSEQTQNTHTTRETDYIFVEQICLPLTQ
uniref:Class I helical cytokine receptor number 27 n=1 Tax=Tetraodon nigroviridis TaxID=99883 RepID=Q6UAM9_TETNG|nr:class I helical cytokine receptor number 27 [Tetraodon nigroviridis]